MPGRLSQLSQSQNRRSALHRELPALKAEVTRIRTMLTHGQPCFGAGEPKAFAFLFVHE